MEHADQNQLDLVDLAKRLIAIPSVSGNEAEALDFVASWMRSANFDEVITDERFTAGLIRAKKQIVKHALILCGHIDTVFSGDESAWRQSPWQPYVMDGRLYGLGATDMKAGVALQMIAAAEYANERRDDFENPCSRQRQRNLKSKFACKLHITNSDSSRNLFCNLLPSLIGHRGDKGRLEVRHKAHLPKQLNRLYRPILSQFQK